MEDYITVGLTMKEMEIIKTCIQFTKSWAKCFDNEETKRDCNVIIDYLNEFTKDEKKSREV